MKLHRVLTVAFLAALLCCPRLTSVYAAGLPQSFPSDAAVLQSSGLPSAEPGAESASSSAPETAPEAESTPEPEAASESGSAPNYNAPPAESPDLPQDSAPKNDTDGEPVYVDLAGITLQTGGFGLAEEAAPYALARYNEQAVIQALVNGMKARQERIDISAYGVPVSDLKALVTHAINGAPELFFVESRYAYWPNSDGTVEAVGPTYNPDYTQEHQQQFETAVSQALQCVNEQMSPLQKMLALHDYLGQHIAYDESLTRFDAYNALVNRSCVCQGYSLAYELLLRRLGLNCEVVTSDAMQHAWNAVQLNGQWYHVDITWDDPLPDKAGYVRHTNFLRSDAGFMDDASPHHDWSFSEACTDASYETGAFWRSSNAAIIYDSGTAYYIDSEARKLMRLDVGGEPAAQYAFSTWPANGGGYYLKVFSGLSRIGDALYFNDSSTLYRWQIGSAGPVAIKTISTAGEHLFGSYCHDGKAELCIGNDPNDKAFSLQQIDLPQPPPPSAKVELTFVDTAAGSSMISGARPKTSVADFLPLAQALAGEDAALTVLDAKGQEITQTPDARVGTGCILKVGDAEHPVIVRGDVSGDGDVKVQDVIVVRQHILNIKPLDGAYLQASLIKSKDEPKVLDVIEMRKFILQIIDTLG